MSYASTHGDHDNDSQDFEPADQPKAYQASAKRRTARCPIRQNLSFPIAQSRRMRATTAPVAIRPLPVSTT
jgi:hypothetical protein